MNNRRRFIQTLASLPFLGSLFAPEVIGAADKNGNGRRNNRDYFKELGVRPFINAAGTFTTLTASLMLPEVMEAMNYASKQFVPLNDLHDAAGKRIAELLQVEAAMVSSGAAGSMTCATLACITSGEICR